LDVNFGIENGRIRMVAENEINCVRISTHIYNNTNEIERFIEIVKKEI
jgi:selenocysteine lyase/cysteine desulfurase